MHIIMLNVIAAENFDVTSEEDGIIIDLRINPKVCRRYMLHSVRFLLILV